jgi:hypothetical protein
MPARKVTNEEIIAALEASPSVAAAARTLGISLRALNKRRARLALQGYSPAHDMVHVVPDGFTARGVSTYYNKEGKPSGQWVIARQDAARTEAMIREMLEAMAEDLPRVPLVPGPAYVKSDLMNTYIITDYHLGMLSWAPETGADWDTELAERMLIRWFEIAIANAPPAAVGVFAQLGDFMHWDGWDAVTPTSRHLLDADTRFPKLVAVATRAVRRVIEMLLAKHERVRVIMAEGNHDMSASVWLRQLCAEVYRDNPRVTVEMRPDPYYCVEFGKTAVFFHHGHKKHLAQLPETFAAKFRETFGRTLHAYAHAGHLHHVAAKESALMLIEQHRTLAAPDAHASRGGWLSARDAQVITYDRNYGETGRLRISAEYVMDSMRAD